MQYCRCLAHVINLATQAFLAAYSKTPHFDPENPEAHIPTSEPSNRDEIGLIRAIAVKVCPCFLPSILTLCLLAILLTA